MEQMSTIVSGRGLPCVGSGTIKRTVGGSAPRAHQGRPLPLFFVRQLNINRVVFYFHWIRQDILTRRTAYRFTCAYIKPRTVPGTGQDIPLKIALVERTTDMGAVIGKCVDSTLDHCQTDQFAIYFDW